MSELRLFLNKIKYIQRERRHALFGVTFSSPGSTTEAPIFEFKIPLLHFRIYYFGGTVYSFGGFEQVSKSWLWVINKRSGRFYVWKTVLPRVVNKKAALNYHLRLQAKP